MEYLDTPRVWEFFDEHRIDGHSRLKRGDLPGKFPWIAMPFGIADENRCSVCE